MIDFLFLSPVARSYFEWCVDPDNPDAPEAVPALVREVCGECQGRGVTWLGRPRWDAVSFGGDEWAEMGPESQDDWISGVYDQPCPVCAGRRVVDVPTPEGTPTAVWEAWVAHEQDEWEHEAQVRAEIRAGC